MSAGQKKGSALGRVGSLGLLETKEDPILVIAGCVCAFVVLLAIVGPLIAPYPPAQTDILHANEGWSSSHWLGTDDVGHDILSRILCGARISLIGPALVVLFGAAAGTLMAITAAWFGGWYDATTMRFANVLFAVPGILVSLLAVAVFGPGLAAPVVGLAIVYSPLFARVCRSVAVQERTKPYIGACQLAGLSSWRICLFHLLPNIRGIIMAQVTIAFGFALIDLAAISFLGLGVQPPHSEWGLTVSEGRTALLNGHPSAALSAGAMIVITVVAFNVLGERLAARAGKNA